jgi:hypothetical protein
MKTLKKGRSTNVFISILFIFVISLVTLLSSCTATLQTPRHLRSEVVIQGQVDNDHHNHRSRDARRERREHRDND